MKTKTLFFFLFPIISSVSMMAQSPEESVRNLLGKDSSISSHFTEAMIQVGHFLNCDPWDNTKPCTDLCDPWDERSCKEQAEGLKTNKEQQAQLIKIIKHFEQALLKGAGGKIITKKQVLQALRKHSGYKIEAMKTRYKLYSQWDLFEAWPSKWIEIQN